MTTISSDISSGLEMSAGELASMLDAELIGPPELRVTRLRALVDAGDGDLAFIRSERYARQWAGSSASAALVTRGIHVPGHDPETRALLVVPDADRALVALMERLAPEPDPPTGAVHETAVVHPDAELAPGVEIGPHCTIEPGARLDEGVRLGAGVYIGRRCVIGAGTTLMPRVTVMHECSIGRACIIHPGVTIGADGFGYVPRDDGRGMKKVPHLGAVRIEDDVEIGANSCVDRGKLDDTVIGAGTKIDNLCQIAHNCRIGRACVICGSAALAGSVTIGDGAVLAGRVSAADNVAIGPGATIGASSGVTRDVPAGQTWIGTPAGPADSHWKNFAAFRRLAEMRAEVRRLARIIERRGLDPR